MVAAGRRPTDRLALLGGPLGPVAGPVLDLPALPVPDAAELLVEDEVLAAGLDLLPRRAAVGDVGADLDEGGEPELGLRPEAVGGVGALAEHVAHGLRLGVLVGDETGVTAVEAAGGVVAQESVAPRVGPLLGLVDLLEPLTAGDSGGRAHVVDLEGLEVDLLLVQLLLNLRVVVLGDEVGNDVEDFEGQVGQVLEHHGALEGGV